MTDDLSPAAHARAIDEARQRLLVFVRQCPDDVWRSAPVPGDPRTVGIALTSGLEAAQLDLDEGRIRRFATIAARHAEGHRTEFEGAPASPA
jgi:hypothetical protein